MLTASCCNLCFRVCVSLYSWKDLADRYNDSSNLLAICGSFFSHSCGALGFRCWSKFTLEGIENTNKNEYCVRERDCDKIPAHNKSKRVRYQTNQQMDAWSNRDIQPELTCEQSSFFAP